MQFEYFTALRYFRSRKSGSRFSGLIQWITVGGLAVGSGGLLLALALTAGFASAIREKLFEFGAHIRVETFGDYPLYRADTVRTTVLKNPGILSAEMVSEMQAMIQSGSTVEGFQLRGIPSLNGFQYLQTYLSKGEAALHPSRGKPAILLGAGLARQLDADTGKIVTVFSLPKENKTRSYSVKQFRVTGIFHTGIDELDGIQAFVSLDNARYLSGLDATAADYVEIRIQPGQSIWEIDNALNDGSLFPYHTVTVFDYYSNIFAWVMLQEKTVPIVISALVLIAAFNLIGTVLMMVLERSTDIGIMRTMGATPKQVLRIFITEGILLGAAGLTLGVSLALTSIMLENRFHFIELPEENYYMSQVSFALESWHFVAVPAFTLLLCFLAAWLPARYASRINPVSTIQFGR
jgi:lipoprotein-releasing system permease protein